VVPSSKHEVQLRTDAIVGPFGAARHAIEFRRERRHVVDLEPPAVRPLPRRLSSLLRLRLALLLFDRGGACELSAPFERVTQMRVTGSERLPVTIPASFVKTAASYFGSRSTSSRSTHSQASRRYERRRPFRPG
jgi:hypothetical protein